MDIAVCAACPHPGPAHAGGGRGRCRFNGCPCEAFERAVPATFPIELAPAQTGPVVSVAAFTVILTGIGFCLGVLLGMNL